MPAIAVVTGAGRGLGRKIAERLAGRYQVLVTDIDHAAATVTASEIGNGAWALAHDVRDPHAHEAVARAARERGELAVWVNNAGVLAVGDAWKMGNGDVRRMVEINLLGVIWGCHAAIPQLATGGHLINIASMSSLVPAPGLAVYGATKHGVLGYSLSLSGELRRAGLDLHVSTLCPDAMAGEMTSAVDQDPSAGILFSSRDMLTLDEVADAAVGLVDRPRLLRTLPPMRGALIHLLRPFPQLGLPLPPMRGALIHLLRPFPRLGLPLLERFAAAGRRRQGKKRA